MKTLENKLDQSVRATMADINFEGDWIIEGTSEVITVDFMPDARIYRFAYDSGQGRIFDWMNIMLLDPGNGAGVLESKLFRGEHITIESPNKFRIKTLVFIRVK